MAVHPSTLRPATSSADVLPALALWGGHECTVNRVGDRWFDQTVRTGHQHRLSDLDLFASLGLQALRYPVLWERVSPEKPEHRDFGWTDQRLRRLQELRIAPILTLCHHGSGPAYTSLVDDSFAPGLARHAQAVAQRYPWVLDWTPVNEPLTTARFSALYGFWYPHTRDEGLFWRALLNEIDATRLAMRVIRQVQPAARLIQTDDLGFCHSTLAVHAEANHQNDRRWMGWDLLCGRVVPGHAMWERLVSFGFEHRLRVIADDPCPPDVIGVNHYLSSERLVDHRLELHPHRSLSDRSLGYCEGVPFVDVDALRHWPPGVVGLPGLLRQAWDRYRLPLAVTECHNGATRDEQVRWFVDTWHGALGLREEGIDLRAVTAWSLLGSCDWNRMVTRQAGHYEPGVFDLRGGAPRETLMARVLRDLVAGRLAQTPALDAPGWWRREARVAPAAHGVTRVPPCTRDGRVLLVASSGDGPLEHLVQRACEVRALSLVWMDLSGLDLSQDPGQWMAHVVASHRPWAVLVADVLQGGTPGMHRQASAARWVAQACDARGMACALIEGPTLAPETSWTAPSSTLVAALEGGVYLPWQWQAPAVRWLRAIDAGVDLAGRPGHPWQAVYGPDLVDALLDLLLDGAQGRRAFGQDLPLDEAQFIDALSRVAAGESLSSREEGMTRQAWHLPGLLPLLETTLERFVREARMAREQGEDAVHRREDDTRAQFDEPKAQGSDPPADPQARIRSA